MNPIRVLVVDDSALFRELLSEVLNSASDIQVVAVARDAEQAIAKLQLMSPDVMTLDLEMPGMNGIDLLRKVLETRPLPVVVVSSLSDQEQAAAVGMRALDAGAFDVVAKPKIDLRSGTLGLANELIAKVQAAAQAKARKEYAPATAMPVGAGTVGALGMMPKPGPGLPPRTTTSGSRPSAGPQRSAGHAASNISGRPAASTPMRRSGAIRSASRAGRIVAIGASTGGTEALLATLSRLPADAGPILIVQHMPAQFTGAFATRLDSLCRIRVKEARDGDRAEVGTALVAPGGFHMRLVRAGSAFVVRISDDPPIGLHRPSVDALFESCARQAGAFAIGILLTGMGADGAYGLGEMHKVGAVTIAQDEATSIVFGMPKAAIERGAATHVLPLNRIPDAITGSVR